MKVYEDPRAAALGLLANQTQAETGTRPDLLMSPLRVAQAIAALAAGGIYTSVTSEAELATELAASTRLIYVASSITLTSDKNVLVDCDIRVAPGATLALGDNAFIVAAGERLTFSGNMFGSVLSWAHTVLGEEAVQLGNASSVEVNGLTLDNNSTANQTFFATDTEEQYAYNFRLLCPNLDEIGFNADGAGGRAFICADNGYIEGGGTSCQRAFMAHVGIQSRLSNLLFKGTWGSEFARIGGASTNLIVNPVDGGGLLSLYAGNHSNIYVAGLSNNGVQAAGTGFVTLRGVRCSSSTNYIDLQAKSLLSNAWAEDIYLSADNCVVSDSHVDQTFDFQTAAHCTVTGCMLDTTGNVTVNGDDNTINACRVGTTAGGGSQTVVVQAGSDRTIIDATRTDAAISDAGTGTVAGDNAVY